MAGVAKPKLSTVKSAGSPTAKFALGSRPASLRDTGLPRVKPSAVGTALKPPAAPKPPVNTRDYGMKTAPGTAIQPGNPMPSMGGGFRGGGKVGW